MDLSAAVNLAELLDQCCQSAELQLLLLPSTITQLGDSCFAHANIAELVFPAHELRILGHSSFSHLHTSCLDLSAAVHLTELPECCFLEAVVNRLKLPSVAEKADSSCFQNARIGELVWL